MNYSFFIRKNYNYIRDNNYIIYPNGKQIHKKIKNCEILISDFTGEKLSFDMLVLIQLWIKDSSTDVIILDKIYKWTFFCPKMEKMNKKINKIVDNYEKTSIVPNPSTRIYNQK